MTKETWLIPDDLLYGKDNYWIKVAGAEATIGMTSYGQHNTGQLIYLELPPAGSALRRGERIGSLESGKWVGKLIMPVSGVVLAANRQLAGNPGLVNQDPYQQGWLLRVRLQDTAELAGLLDAAAYRNWIAAQEQEEAANGAVL